MTVKENVQRTPDDANNLPVNGESAMPTHESTTEFLDHLDTMTRVFEGCGNMLGIVPLTAAGYEPSADFRQDATLRAHLAQWGRQIQSDSVMVLVGDPRNREAQGYHTFMYVFEPNGSDDSGMDGGVSTMCGNGIRAVAAYIHELDPQAERAEIMAMSGLRSVEFVDDMYAVQMGTLTQAEEDLANYIKPGALETTNGEYFNSPIPEPIVQRLAEHGINAQTWSIGFNGDRDENGNIDGEPHLIIEVPADQVKDIVQLRQLAVEAGPIITKDTARFPREINANFIVVQGLDSETGKLHVLIATHERNLGDDADHSVTAACGTGSTVSAGTVLRRYAPDVADQVIVVHNTGGDLEISRDTDNPQRLVMVGPANACDVEPPTTVEE